MKKSSKCFHLRQPENVKPARGRLVVAATLALLMAPGFTYADLYPRAGGTMVYDSDTNITWISNANLAGASFNWSSANSWAQSLVYGGFDDWRLPSAVDIYVGQTCGGTVEQSYNWDGPCVSEMGHLFKEELGGFVGAALADLGLDDGDQCGKDRQQRHQFAGRQDRDVNQYAQRREEGDAGRADIAASVFPVRK